MNTSMFYFYLAGVTNTVESWLVAAIVMLIILLIVFGVAGGIQRTDPGEKTTIHDNLIRNSRKWGWSLGLMIILSALLPSKEFLYTAAGLKAGETVVSTEMGQKAVTLITQQIDELLEQ